MRYLYTLLLTLAMPVVLLRLLWRSRKSIGYRQRWAERFGYIPTIAHTDSIWLHAVSVGEVIAATPLIKALLHHYPKHTLVVTSTTPSGSAQVMKTFNDQIAHNRIVHVYAPMDLPSAVRRFLQRCRPQLSIIMETELWPNLLHYTHARGIPIMLANARLADRSYCGYRRIAGLTGAMLRTISLVAAQSEMDGERFIRLGLTRKQLLVTGNIKFDLQLPAALSTQGKQLHTQWGNRPTIIAASTHEGEEAIILTAFTQIRTRYLSALLILVPRHPERFAAVAKLCQTNGFTIVQRSRNELPTKNTAILLGDTMGELRLLYAASDIAFVGGSLVPVGGHNLIEPAAVRLAILTGPHLHNFVAIHQLLTTAHALMVVNDAATLSARVLELLDNETLRQAMGDRAYRVSANNTGALAQHLQWIDNHFQPPVPQSTVVVKNSAVAQ